MALNESAAVSALLGDPPRSRERLGGCPAGQGKPLRAYPNLGCDVLEQASSENARVEDRLRAVDPGSGTSDRRENPGTLNRTNTRFVVDIGRSQSRF
jgi:hypothetical protein